MVLGVRIFGVHSVHQAGQKLHHQIVHLVVDLRCLPNRRSLAGENFRQCNIHLRESAIHFVQNFQPADNATLGAASLAT